jgi:hypothetical protein
MTDFEAEHAAASITACDEGAWAKMRRILDRQQVASASEEAALKLISNHAAVLRDVTNTDPVSQRDLRRIDPSNSMYVDQALREVARRLLQQRPGAKRLPCETMDASNADHVASWLNTAAYLSGRIQAEPHERPGRQPDMSAQAAAAMRAVLQELWWEAWEVQRASQRRR